MVYPSFTHLQRQPVVVLDIGQLFNDWLRRDAGINADDEQHGHDESDGADESDGDGADATVRADAGYAQHATGCSRRSKLLNVNPVSASSSLP